VVILYSFERILFLLIYTNRFAALTALAALAALAAVIGLAALLSLLYSRCSALASLLSLHCSAAAKRSQSFLFVICLSRRSFCLSRMSPNHKWLERSTSFFGFINIIIIAVFWRLLLLESVFFYGKKGMSLYDSHKQI